MDTSKCKVSGLFNHLAMPPYKLLSDLPSAKAVRTLESNFIGNIIEQSQDKGSHEIVSIGIARGELYRRLLKNYFQMRRLRLIATESEEYLASVAKDEFPGEYMDALSFSAVEPGHSSIFLKDGSIIPELPQNHADFIEVSFVLNTYLLKIDILKILTYLYKLLRVGGTLILADIDCSIGSYIESKIRSYMAFFNEMSIDATRGYLTGVKHKNHKIPFMDLKNSPVDRDFFQKIYNENLLPLNEEITSSLLPEAQEVADNEHELFSSGLRYYRTCDEWKELIRSVFGFEADVMAYTSKEIKKKFTDVKDKPFIIFTVKR